MNASNNMAICLHGEDFDENLPEFFTKHYNMQVFGHFITNSPMKSTDNISFSVPTAMQTRDHRLSDIARADHQAANWSTMRHADASLAISMSLANKRTHELANNMRFDRVICMESSVLQKIDQIIHSQIDLQSGTIYARYQRRATMNNLWEIDTSIMVGESRDMDTMSRFHHAYITGEFWQIFSSGELDPSDHLASLGILLWKWANLRNLRIHDL